MNVTAIIPAAGCGKRMRSKTSKPFIRLCGKEIICYCLEQLEDTPLISEVIIAADERHISRLRRLIKKRGFAKVRDIIKGGSTRYGSVRNALKRSNPEADILLVHDCARPMAGRDLIEKTIKAAMKYDCAIAAVKVKPTIKLSDSGGGFISRTLDRDILWEAQTPQAFKAYILKQAYKQAGGSKGVFTDDAGVVERAGNKVKIVLGGYRNIKITTPEDMIIAKALLNG
jgi:2-C-methyl-D-erythritol 4-phosphate cytidylyltransferase